MKKFILLVFLANTIFSNCFGQDTNCQDFSVWLGIECGYVDCGLSYQVFLTFNGFETEDSYTIVDNLANDTIEHSNNVFLSTNIPLLRPYSFTIYPTGFEECAQTVEGTDGNCSDKGDFPINDSTKIFYNQIEYFVCPGDTAILDVFANHDCDPMNIIEIGQDASPYLGLVDEYNSATLILNDDNTISYIADEQVSSDYIYYIFEDHYGNENIGVLVIDNTEPFLIIPEKLCDKQSGTVEIVFLVDNEVDNPNLDNLQYKNCNDENWIDITEDNVDYYFSSDNGAVFAFTYNEQSTDSVCLEFRDLDFPCYNYSYSNQYLSCITTEIELLSFNGKKERNTNTINWSTATEKDNDYFILEKSFDGKMFKEIARINAIGNSNVKQNYRFTDTKKINHLCYYRLVTVDKNGNDEITSEVINIKGTRNIVDLNIYPNPTVEVLNLNLSSNKHQNAIVKIIDITGKVILTKQIENDHNQVQIDINALPKGIYIIKYEDNDNSFTERFVKG